MVIEIKRPITSSKLTKAQRDIQRKRKKKGFNPDSFLGKINWGNDGLKLQKLMRNEWH